MRKITCLAITTAMFLLFLSGCGVLIKERIQPVYAPQVGGITPSSVDQRCRIDVISKVTSDLFDFYKNGEKNTGKTVILRTVNAPNSDEIIDYVYRVFAKNGVAVEKCFDKHAPKGTDNILTVYPVVDGCLNSETREKLNEERGYEVMIHARLYNVKEGKIYWAKDFSSKKFVSIVLPPVKRGR